MHTYTHLYKHTHTHSSMGLAECGLLDSSGMAKAAHPSALCLSNAVTCQRACVRLDYVHTYVQTNTGILLQSSPQVHKTQS